jgi:hypothetical protein
VMTAKSYCYACAGIFLLVAAWTMGAQHARANVHPNNGSHVLAMTTQDSSAFPWALRSDGTLWHYGGNTWNEVPSYPVPPELLSRIIFFPGNQLCTSDGQMWNRTGSGWQPLGDPLPLGTVDVESSTWSDLKDGYRKR